MYGRIYLLQEKTPRQKRRRFFLIFIIFISVGIFIYQQNAVFNLLVNICKDNAYAVSAFSVNKAVAYSLTEETNYSDLISVEKNGAGEIVMISANAIKINKITRSVSDNTLKILSEKLKEGIDVPIFAFSGVAFLSGVGKDIKFKSINVSAVNCDISGDFKSVGINQTLHSVYALVTSKINVEFLRFSKEIEFESKVLLSEAVLVGKVPEIYLSGGAI